MEDAFDAGLGKNRANHVPLTPVSFVERSALVYPDKVAVRHGDLAISYADFLARCRRLASALVARGIGRGDTVAILAPNIPAMLEAHFAVPAIGAILNPLNYRLDAATVAFCLRHGQAKALLVDPEYATIARDALRRVDSQLLVVDIDDPLAPEAEPVGSVRYEALLAEGAPGYAWPGPADEWDAMCLLYTSGTTGDPKGVVYHHRGGYLNALGNALVFALRPESVYLWTLPMFHCSGWTYTWAVTAAGATHVCLRRVDPALIFPAIDRHRVTHMCGAPIVLSTLIHAPAALRRRSEHIVDIATGGAAPPSAVIAGMESMGFRVTHLYGLTESYGPSTVCMPQADWDGLALDRRALRMARQGVPMPTLAELTVADPLSHQPVPRDGRTLGELMLRGNTVMKGYLKNAAATKTAFREGWYHTGDLAVWHPDNYIEIKDRSKDIIISGGENISSLEVEECLYRHPAVMEAAVVAQPDPKWGESPCAFVTLKPGSDAVDADDIVQWCRDHLAHFKVPRRVEFGPLPKTSTGKIQKFVLRARAKSGDAGSG